jgi:6-phosphogluconolactonase
MFAIDPSGSHLFVANKDSDNVAIFRINRETGRLTPIGQPFYVPDPVFIIFVPVD